MSESAAHECQQRRKKKPIAISDLVYIFIDASNVIHEGSRELGIVKGLNIDHNRLVTKVLNGRKLGEVYIVGSTPPPPLPNQCNNRKGLGPSLNHNRGVTNPEAEEQQENTQKYELERAKDHGFIVNVFQRNSQNKEKKVDVQLTCNIMNTIHVRDPGTLVLVAGDSDYFIPLNEAKKLDWEVETWFWPTGMSNDFKNWPYSSLKIHYMSFIYVIGFTESKFTLEINGDMIRSWKWRNEPIKECFSACASNIWYRFHWVDDITVHLYFNTETQLKFAKGWLTKKYPDMLIKG